MKYPIITIFSFSVLLFFLSGCNNSNKPAHDIQNTLTTTVILGLEPNQPNIMPLSPRNIALLRQYAFEIYIQNFEKATPDQIKSNPKYYISRDFNSLCEEATKKINPAYSYVDTLNYYFALTNNPPWPVGRDHMERMKDTYMLTILTARLIDACTTIPGR